MCARVEGNVLLMEGIVFRRDVCLDYIDSLNCLYRVCVCERDEDGICL